MIPWPNIILWKKIMKHELNIFCNNDIKLFPQSISANNKIKEINALLDKK